MESWAKLDVEFQAEPTEGSTETISEGTDQKPNWPGFMTQLQSLPPGMSVKLTVQRGKEVRQFEMEPIRRCRPLFDGAGDRRLGSD
jgi:hypothetical protein